MQIVPLSGVLVLYDLSTGFPRPLAPGSLWKSLFLQLMVCLTLESELLAG